MGFLDKREKIRRSEIWNEAVYDSAPVYNQGPHSSLIFLVEIEKLYEHVEPFLFAVDDATKVGRIGFSEISGISMGVETKTYWEGSSPFPKHVPVRSITQGAVFRKGIAPLPQYEALVTWVNVVKGAAMGEYDELPTSTITILVPGDPRFPLTSGKVIENPHVLGPKGVGQRGAQVYHSEIILEEAWPTSITFGDFNAARSEVLISDMEIVYHNMRYETGSSA
jgi:hypothetical protein